MTATPDPGPEPARGQRTTDHGPRTPDEFRWQGFFQRAAEALFLLDRRRRILFANRAWEGLTGLPAGAARGLLCKRSRDPAPGSPEALAGALAPPAEVLRGQPGRARRLIPGTGAGPRWWDI